MLLLNPGPVTLSARVRQALQGPDLCHREPEFSALQDEIRARLLAVYGLAPAEWTAVLLTGSGTAALEAMLTTLVPRGGHLLVVENGVYGERLARIAELHAIRCTRVTHTWGAALDHARIAAALGADPGITHLAAVHHETTTGRLNDLGPLAALCRRHAVRLLVDAVSSFGGEPIECHTWDLAACAATANKCLHGIPGAAFVVVRRADLAAAAQPPRTLYLDLAGYARAQEAGGTPFTQSVQAFYALAEALRELEDAGGWAVRHAHYRFLARIVRDGLQGLGLEPLLEADASSVVLGAYRLAPGLDYRTLHDGLKARGFVIYAGQGELARTLFRISTMGALTEADMHRLVDAVAALRR